MTPVFTALLTGLAEEISTSAVQIDTGRSQVRARLLAVDPALDLFCPTP